MSSSKTDQTKKPPPSLRSYSGGLTNKSPIYQKKIIDAKNARKMAIATLPDRGMLGPSAKNRYVWIGTDLEEKIKKQASSNNGDELKNMAESVAESWYSERDKKDNAKKEARRGYSSDHSIEIPLARALEFDFGF